MYRYLIALTDLLHLAANIAFFVVAFNSSLYPAVAFIYLPLALLTIWSSFFGLRAWLVKAEQQFLAKEYAKLFKAQVRSKFLSPVLKSGEMPITNP